VVVEQLAHVYQVRRIAVCHQGAPRFTLFSPAQHLAYVFAADYYGAVQASGFDRA